MNIGFDAKRAFHNNTGLGNYSRTLIQGLAQNFPEHDYFLFNPKPSAKLYQPSYNNVHEVLPQNSLHRKFSSAWRTFWMTQNLTKKEVQLYHGLSGELPSGIRDTSVKSIVTIHDLIFERYPEQYGNINTVIYRKKFRYACKVADKIIAISNQTKSDLIEYYSVDALKIEVCYQSCNPVFAEKAAEDLKTQIKIAYNLPDQFFLYVGSIIERKNLLNICKALKSTGSIPLVVVGNGKKYKDEVKSFIKKEGIDHLVHFLSEQKTTNEHLSLNNPTHLAALYQMALAMIYPSVFEGFGIPVLEALWSGLPVITSNTSCLPETAGDAALLVDPSSVSELATAMSRMASDPHLRELLIAKGFRHASNFTLKKCTTKVMELYKSVV